MKPRIKLLTIVVVAVAVLLAVPEKAQAALITIDELNDAANDDGDCSLREAIQAANTDTAVDACLKGSGADTIEVPPGTYSLTMTNVGSSEDENATGDLDVRSDVTIVGTGAFPSEIDAASLGDRVMHIRCDDDTSVSDITVTLQNLRFTNGSTETSSGGGVVIQDCFDFVGGQAVSNVTIEDSEFDGNGAQAGGGVRDETSGAVTIRRSTFTNNIASLSGGGLGTCCGGTVTIEDSTLSGNQVTSTNSFAAGGAGIMINGTTTIRRTTVSGNLSGTNGGGIACQYATATLENSTISGNTGAGQGGGGLIQGLNGGSNACTITVDSCTITGNMSGGDGGGYFVDAGSATLTNTIVAGNDASDAANNCAGAIIDGGNNFDNDGSCPGATPIVAGLDFEQTLAANGGPTLTHALLPGSVAQNAAGVCGLATDQRGVPRSDGFCDSGAYEFDAVCGNGILEPPEVCDDGNAVGGDGCSADCMSDENVDPTSDGSQYAWGEHIGWLNAEPQGEGGMGVQVTDTELTGWIWAGDYGWISLSCQNTSSCGVNDYGVVNDGKGNLSGFAWGEHLGWINFGTSGGSDCCSASGTPGCSDSACEAVICPATPSCCNGEWDATCAAAAAVEPACIPSCAADPFGVQIHGFTGEFSGFAWTEHNGWINFGTAPVAQSHQIETSWRCSDPDVDGICTASDNCATYSNPGQGTVPFGQPVLAGNKTDFVWAVTADWELAKGTFTTSASIGSYVVDFYDTGSGTVHTDLGFPGTGFGYWYIFRPNCPVGSYSSGTASQQGDRDGALIP